MIETNIPDINVDEIMEEIREKVKKRKSQRVEIKKIDRTFDYKQNFDNVSFNEKETRFYSFARKVSRLLKIFGLYGIVNTIKRKIPDSLRYSIYYNLEDFMQYYDVGFIDNAYKGILARDPDVEGMKVFLSRLRNAKLNKIEILGRLRFSKEGRSKGVRIKGLLFPYLLNTVYNQVPVIGYVLRLFTALVRLPVILRTIQKFEAFTDERFNQNKTHINRLDSEFRQELNDIQRQIRDHRYNILDQQRRLSLLLEEARKRLPEPISTEQIENMLTEEDHLLDAMFVTFEDQFRGTREDIKERQRIYIPYIDQVNAGTDDRPLLDVGCGRGEWLELVKESGYVAKGIDINRIMVQQCKEFGLDVTEADVISFLREQKPNSFAAITGFHIIEHLPFKSLIRLLDESLRVLYPGGIVIFETPNPENLIVGACNFYVDPTHRHPLPPQMMRFLVESRGFYRVEIHSLHPVEKEHQLFENETEIIKKFDQFFFSSQDYAVIGVKA